MKAHLEALAQPAAARISDNKGEVAVGPEPFERRQACADSHRAEAATPGEVGAYSLDRVRHENPPAVPAEARHAWATPRCAPPRDPAQLESSRLNCARGVWRYAAGYWFMECVER